MYRRTYKHEVKREEAIPTLLPRSRSSGCRSHERECRCGTQAATLPAKETHSRNPRHNWLEVIIASDDCDARTPINQSIINSASRGQSRPSTTTLQHPHHSTTVTVARSHYTALLTTQRYSAVREIPPRYTRPPSGGGGEREKNR